MDWNLTSENNKQPIQWVKVRGIWWGLRVLREIKLSHSLKSNSFTIIIWISTRLGGISLRQTQVPPEVNHRLPRSWHWLWEPVEAPGFLSVAEDGGHASPSASRRNRDRAEKSMQLGQVWQFSTGTAIDTGHTVWVTFPGTISPTVCVFNSFRFLTF